MGKGWRVGCGMEDGMEDLVWLSHDPLPTAALGVPACGSNTSIVAAGCNFIPTSHEYSNVR